MVPRYARPEMTAIWAPENRFRIWFEIEALAAEAMAAQGAIPAEAARTIRERGAARVARYRPGRPRPHRRDRAGDAARRDRLPDLARRGDRPRQPLRPSGHDQQRRARHLPLGAADPGRRPAAGRPRPRAGRARAARARAQVHADHRPQPRHPCRADQLRPEARRPLRRVRPQPRPPGAGAGRDRGLRHQRRGRHLRPSRSRRWRRTSRPGSACSRRRSPPR